MDDLKPWLKQSQKEVDSALGRFLPRESAAPKTIHKAMRYSIFAGGKRLRPILTLAAAEACGGEIESALAPACATELIAFNPTTKRFDLQADAVRLLKGLHGPVGVVAVCGRARMGKSTLLNQLVCKLNGGGQEVHARTCLLGTHYMQLMAAGVHRGIDAQALHQGSLAMEQTL